LHLFQFVQDNVGIAPFAGCLPKILKLSMKFFCPSWMTVQTRNVDDALKAASGLAKIVNRLRIPCFYDVPKI